MEYRNQSKHQGFKQMIFFRNLVVIILVSSFSAAIAEEMKGKCLLEVNEKKYINGACIIDMDQDGSFLIKPVSKKPTYFAIVNVEKNTGVGYWNEEPNSTHAHTSLGDLKKKGGCWQNENAKVCAWK
jgi:hypothetical protein